MNVLKEFKGKCRGKDYTYRLFIIDDELILQAFDAGQLVDNGHSWHDTPMNRTLLEKACLEIMNR